MSRKPAPPPATLPDPTVFVPSRVFFTSGKGFHEKERVSLQHALVDAGIGDCNLVKVSSVIPPGCVVISREEGEKLLRPGCVVFAVIAKAQTNEPHQRLTVGLGWAIPDHPTSPGFIAEIEEDEANGLSAEAAADEVGPMAVRILAEQLRAGGADPEALWSRRKSGFKFGRYPVTAGCLTETVIGDEKGRYASAVAVAVYL